MKIWIDLGNSPQVHFFAGMIRDLEAQHEVLLTCRPLANTVELLDLGGFTYHIVGKHYGRSILKKAGGFGVRILQLYRFLSDRRVDIAISHSSFYSPVVAQLLGVKSIYLNDNEHAAGNLIAFRFADRVMVPEFLDVTKVTRQGARPDKILAYPGVKEGIYLWNRRSTSKPVAVTNGKRQIFIRPEPWSAQYYSGKCNFIDDLLIALKDHYRLVLLPRGSAQRDHYSQEKFLGVSIPSGSLALEEIMGSCDLFIGAGGTMTREAAVLGIPTLSIYQGDLLDVDAYLLKEGFMTHARNPSAEYIVQFLERSKKRPPDPQLLMKGKSAYDLIKQTLLDEKERTIP